MNQLPTIRITRGFLLESQFQIPTKGIDPIVKQYKQAWNRRGLFVLQRLYETTGLSFAQNYIDIYVTNPTSQGSISDPLIIGAGVETRDFVCVLTHELIHRLTSDNTAKVNWHSMAQKLYSMEKVDVANHVMVHAILEAIFSSQIISRDINHCAEFPAYKRAWEIVKEIGYKDIISHFRKEGRK